MLIQESNSNSNNNSICGHSVNKEQNEEQPSDPQKQLMYYANKEKQNIQNETASTIDPFLVVTQPLQKVAPTASNNSHNSNNDIVNNRNEQQLPLTMHRYNVLPNREPLAAYSEAQSSRMEFDDFDEEEQFQQTPRPPVVAGGHNRTMPFLDIQGLLNQFTVSVTGIVFVLFFYFAIFPSHRHPPLILVVITAVMFLLAIMGQILRSRICLGIYLLMAAVVEGYVTTILFLNGFEVESLVGASGVLLFFSLLNGIKLFLNLQKRTRLQGEY